MKVFVHGVPETDALWDQVRAQIDAPSVALSLPGFGCPRPDGFGATKDDYADWLTGELETIDEPIDLVGHDWGAGITYRVVTQRDDLVRSWAADVANLTHPNYVWHDFAKIWQTPGEGEAFFEGQSDQPAEARGGAFEAMGVPHSDAVAMASWADETMAGCILDLYRSATPNPHADWGDDLAPTAAPGLVLHASDDPFGDETLAREMASTLGARFVTLDGLGHWWPFQGPKQAADALQAFWDELD